MNSAFGRAHLGSVDTLPSLDYTSSLTDGLKGFWLPLPSNKGGSRLYDLSARARHGDLITPPAWTADRDFSHPVLSFDEASSEYIEAAGLSRQVIPSDGDFTIIVTVRVPSGADSDDTIFVQNNPPDNDNTILLYSVTDFGSANNQPRFWAQATGELLVGDDIRGAGVTQLAVRRDGSTYTLFQDGTVVDTASNSTAFGTATRFRWGRVSDLGRYFDGVLGETAVYERALSDSRVQRYTQQRRRGFPDLLRRRDQSALYVSAAGAVTASVSDTLSLTDTRTTTATASTSRSDTVTVSSSESASLSVAEQLSDTLSLTDAADVAVIFGPSRTDAFTLSESTSTSATFSGSVSDALTLSDTASASLAVAGAVADTLGITDTITATVSGTITASVSDTLTLTDNASVTATFAGALTDLLTLTDTQSGTTSGVIAASVSDTLTLSDTQSASTTLSASVSDAITLDDNLDVVANAVAEVADTIGLTDTVSVTLDLSADLSDTITVSDTALGALAGRATTVSVSADTKYEITLSTDGKYQITVTAEPIIESS